MEFGKREDNYSKASVMEDYFRNNGPIHLKCVDWTSANDRKSVAASLVNGVYVIEKDRLFKRDGENALAPIWWGYFQFQLMDTLKEKDGSIFAAIFEYKGTYNYNHYTTPSYYTPTTTYNTPQHPPRYVLAFRGTITEPSKTMFNDVILDAQVALKRSLSQDFRCRNSFEKVENLVTKVGPTNIWMVGHSLGATLALQIGKAMAHKKYYIETYLFNPPFPTLPFEQFFKDEKIKRRIQVVRNFVGAKLSHFVNKSCWLPEHDPFLALCTWIPQLFVHPSDPICSGYIGYFEFRKTMESMGLGDVNKVAIKNSIFNLIAEAIGKGGEAMHLIPSARVTKSIRCNVSFREAHGLRQWWQEHCDWQCQLH